MGASIGGVGAGELESVRGELPWELPPRAGGRLRMLGRRTVSGRGCVGAGALARPREGGEGERLFVTCTFLVFGFTAGGGAGRHTHREAPRMRGRRGSFELFR